MDAFHRELRIIPYAPPSSMGDLHSSYHRIYGDEQDPRYLFEPKLGFGWDSFKVLDSRFFQNRDRLRVRANVKELKDLKHFRGAYLSLYKYVTRGLRMNPVQFFRKYRFVSYYVGPKQIYDRDRILLAAKFYRYEYDRLLALHKYMLRSGSEPSRSVIRSIGAHPSSDSRPHRSTGFMRYLARRDNYNDPIISSMERRHPGIGPLRRTYFPGHSDQGLVNEDDDMIMIRRQGRPRDFEHWSDFINSGGEDNHFNRMDYIAGRRIRAMFQVLRNEQPLDPDFDSMIESLNNMMDHGENSNIAKMWLKYFRSPFKKMFNPTIKVDAHPDYPIELMKYWILDARADKDEVEYVLRYMPDFNGQVMHMEELYTPQVRAQLSHDYDPPLEEEDPLFGDEAPLYEPEYDPFYNPLAGVIQHPPGFSDVPSVAQEELLSDYPVEEKYENPDLEDVPELVQAPSLPHSDPEPEPIPALHVEPRRALVPEVFRAAVVPPVEAIPVLPAHGYAPNYIPAGQRGYRYTARRFRERPFPYPKRRRLRA